MFLGPELIDMRNTQPVVSRQGERNGRTHPCDLLHADAVVDRGHPGSAVLFRDLDTQEAQFAKSRHQLDRKVLRLIPLKDMRSNFRFGELPNCTPEKLLFVGKFEINT